MEITEIMKSSIFRQKVYAERYFCSIMTSPWYVGNFGVEKRIRVDRDSNQEPVADTELFTCDIEMPLLKVGEKFFIEELNLQVNVIDLCRTSKNKVVYYVENKYIEDEKTKQTREEAEKQFAKFEEIAAAYKQLLKIVPKWVMKLLSINILNME